MSFEPEEQASLHPDRSVIVDPKIPNDGLAYHYPFKSLVAGAFMIDDPDIELPAVNWTVVLKHDVSDDEANRFIKELETDEPLRLGLSALRRFHVFISTKDGLIFFVPTTHTSH